MNSVGCVRVNVTCQFDRTQSHLSDTYGGLYSVYPLEWETASLWLVLFAE